MRGRTKRALVRVALLSFALLVQDEAGAAQDTAVREWQELHEMQILDEFLALLRIPNVASDEASMRRNAELLTTMFLNRGFAVEATADVGSPVLIARYDARPSRGTITFYAHYDGQPVDPTQWTHCGPFEACLVGPAGRLDETPARLDREMRVYARSASDDKAPIIALLNAVDALRATGNGPAWSLRVVLDGQEEAGSDNFERFMAARGEELRGDLAVMLDGPRHPSGRPTLYFGVRGQVNLTVTVVTALGDLHSGNYGNWAPDPSIQLGRLLASTKDESGRVLVDGFYDDVTPLTPAEQEALDAVPDIEAELAVTFGIARPERPSERLETKLNQPTLNVLAMESGGGTSAPPRTAIPAFARARIGMRMVNGLDPAKQAELVITHIRRQGYHVALNRDPTTEERLAHPLLARIDTPTGSQATRVPLESPFRIAVAAALTLDGIPPVQLPTLGGSLPFGAFSEGLGMTTVGVSLVNHDNNQHGPDENLRLQNLWEAIEILARLMTMPRF